MQTNIQVAPMYPMVLHASKGNTKMQTHNQTYNIVQTQPIYVQLRRTLQVQQVRDSSEQENYTVRFLIRISFKFELLAK